MKTNGGKKDLSTGILLIAALLLLGLVILFFQKDLILSLFNSHRSTTGTVKEQMRQPHIERIDELEERNTPLETEPTAAPDTKAPDSENQLPSGPAIKAPIYYITVNDDGAIHLKSVFRSVPDNGDPERSALESLLNGPDSGEITKGTFSMIPTDSRLISFEIRDRTAFCSFNEEFQFNDLGREGYISQLAQIVFTLTEFETIDRVQILIDGKLMDYLGADGVPIREPLDRSHF